MVPVSFGVPPLVRVIIRRIQKEDIRKQKKMNPSALSVLLLLADPVWHVEYPKSFCVVKGSTTTIPCSFTYPVYPQLPGGLPGVNRVVWCTNHEICQGITPSVYDSNKPNDNRDLTIGNTGNYTCSLDPSKKKRSLPCSLLVEADELAGLLRWSFVLLWTRPGTELS
ncbi:hypothetical protein CRUP_007673, partial [Coryphaenoides rupestris]